MSSNWLRDGGWDAVNACGSSYSVSMDIKDYKVISKIIRQYSSCTMLCLMFVMREECSEHRNSKHSYDTHGKHCSCNWTLMIEASLCREIKKHHKCLTSNINWYVIVVWHFINCWVKYYEINFVDLFFNFYVSQL